MCFHIKVLKEMFIFFFWRGVRLKYWKRFVPWLNLQIVIDSCLCYSLADVTTSFFLSRNVSKLFFSCLECLVLWLLLYCVPPPPPPPIYFMILYILETHTGCYSFLSLEKEQSSFQFHLCCKLSVFYEWKVYVQLI